MERIKSRGFESASLFAIGNILRQVVGFIMLPVYTTYLSPEDYGVIGLMAFFIIVVEALFGARLMDAVLRFYHRGAPFDQKAVISTAFWVTSIASAFVVFGLVYFRDPISNTLFGEQGYQLAFALFAGQTLTQAIEYYGLLYLRIQERPYLFFWISIAKLIIQLLLNILLVVFYELGVLGVAMSGLISTTIIGVGVSVYCLSRVGLVFNTRIAIAMIKYSWPLWFAGLAALYVSSSNRYFIKEYASLFEVGLFELGAKMASMLLVVIWTPFAYFWANERYKIFNDESRLDEFSSYYKLLLKLLGLGVFGICALSPPLISLMAQDEFYGAIQVVPYLAFGLMFYALFDFFNFGFLATDKTKQITVVTYASAGIISILYFFVIPQFGFVGAGAALMIVQLLQFIYSSRLNSSMLGISDYHRPVLIIVTLVLSSYLLLEFVSEVVKKDYGVVADIFVRVIFCCLMMVFLLWPQVNFLVKKLKFSK